MKISKYRLIKLFGLVLMGVLPLFSCGNPFTPPVELVLRGGKIATVDDKFSFAEAVAISKGKIISVSSNKKIEKYIGSDTQVIDLEGKLVVPGLIDAHAHLTGYARSLLVLDLRGLTSYRQVIDMVAEKAKTLEPGEWILGRSWDQNDWEDVDDLPFHDALSEVTQKNPVWLTRVDGHAGLANKYALHISGISKQTNNPDGGEILRKPNGDPTGVFIDRAMGMVSKNILDFTGIQLIEAIEMASNNCLAAGLTCVHDAGASPEIIKRYKRLIYTGKIKIRIYAMLGNPVGDRAVTSYLKMNRIDNYEDHFLTVKSIKLFVDGALGSRGAKMFESYSDREGHNGLLTLPYERILQVSRNALEAGFQVCTHAIGDEGNRLTLNAYEQALKEHPSPDHRFRVEHAQIVSLEDIPRFSEIGVLPSMQPTHATSDMYWAEERVGPERIKGAYAWQKFLKTGVIIPCGSDFPVEEINPMLGIYAAVTRQGPDEKPEGGWYPGECMTREQALRGFTIWAAYAAFQEDILGSIEEGKLADMVVLSKDILTVPPKEILTTVPEYTIVGGKILYRCE
ncbi:MAG: amidohydrolase [Candidatus Latescibacteria bacterium]|nr:amidohydrolase [Candidatus Latescibacterota bacterium]